MNLNSRKLIGAAVLALCLLGGAGSAIASGQKSVVVVSKDGTRQEVILPEVQRIDIGTEGIVLHTTTGSPIEVSHGNLDRILIGEESTAVKEAIAGGNIAVWPTRVSDNVNVGGLEGGCPVSVFDLSGALVASATASPDGLATMSLAALRPGVYLVSTGSVSVKIIKI